MGSYCTRYLLGGKSALLLRWNFAIRQVSLSFNKMETQCTGRASFADIVSQGSVATRLRCGETEIFNYHTTANLLQLCQ